MKIEVRVKASAKKISVEEQSDGTFIVMVKEPAREGRANDAVIEALALHFQVPKRAIKLVRGSSSRQKLFEVPTN